MLANYEKVEALMSPKMHVAYSHIDFFLPNLSDVSDEQKRTVQPRHLCH